VCSLAFGIKVKTIRVPLKLEQVDALYGELLITYDVI
jgi:hypothetical protein